MKTMRKFTCDSLMKARCQCSKCKPTAIKATKALTVDRVVAVDLNAIHRRFWNRQAGRNQ